MNLVVLAILLMGILWGCLCSREGFLNPNPYDSLEVGHYAQLYPEGKSGPVGVGVDGFKPKMGYYKSYPDYYDDPSKLKSFYLGYSVSGIPYDQYAVTGKGAPSKKEVDLRNLPQPYYYGSEADAKRGANWLNYAPPRPNQYYNGYPFYFGDKYHR